VAWIDPNFVDLGGLQGADDDHPPTDVMSGQSFVLRVYRALSSSEIWDSTMLVVVYDEHGGFYDHVDPTDAQLPESFSERSEFGHFGPRVPAFVVSPLVERGIAYGSSQDNDPRYVFDHCSLIKTILLRFANDNCDGLPERVSSATHLGHLLTATPRKPPEVPRSTIDSVAKWWGNQIAERLEYPLATIPALSELGVEEGVGGAQGVLQGIWDAINRLVDRLPFVHRPAAAESPPVELSEPNELEQGVASAAKAIREQGLRPGRP
jgi:Phosphoesterase family